MLFETIGQPRIFLWMLASGMLIGAWYALLAGLRGLLRAGVWLALACDVLFGLGAAALFCAALYAASYGAVRLYAALAALMGFAVFMLGAWPPGRRAIYALNCSVHRFFVKIRRYRWINVIFK